MTSLARGILQSFVVSSTDASHENEAPVLRKLDACGSHTFVILRSFVCGFPRLRL